MSWPIGRRKPVAVSYTGEMPASPKSSLRSEQVAQTRAALVTAGRELFGRDGYAATSVEDLARQARVTTGAMYHHFPNKAALFEAVFEQVHMELLEASARAVGGQQVTDAPITTTGSVDWFAAGFDAFLDQVLKPDVQQIIITDAPAVLGLARFTELDERYAFAAIVTGLRAGAEVGLLEVDDPETMARLLLGALTRAGMLIASSDEPTATRDAVSITMRSLLRSLAPHSGRVQGGRPPRAVQEG
jgi:AcrR family transcriptional regulator